MPIPMRKRLAILENAILPENVSREFALNILKYGHILTHSYTSKEFEEIDKLKAFLNANKWKVVEFVKILINCEDVFESCQWNTERIDCESGLKVVINKEFQQQSDEEDSYNSMNFSMKNNGIVVVIHDRMDFPGLSSNMYMLQTNHELKIAIKPELIQKPKGLRHRNKENQLVPLCIAEDQNTLEYFSIYGYSNCYANCRVKAMLRYCGCLPFIYDNVAEYNKIKRCELDRLRCIQRNAKKIRIVKNIQSKNVSCSCRTPCTYMNYDGFPNSIPLMKTSSTNVSQKSTILNVYMNSQTYQVSITLSAANESYLLASVGGIFSLFLGCSFLSVAEIIYFVYLFFRASLKSSQKSRNLNTS
ncbi:sodium channel protein Nach [Apis mellifera carnica]|nr:sodium channel protein Nach [Apis mellifera carnica]